MLVNIVPESSAMRCNQSGNGYEIQEIASCEISAHYTEVSSLLGVLVLRLPREKARLFQLSGQLCSIVNAATLNLCRPVLGFMKKILRFTCYVKPNNQNLLLKLDVNM